MVVGLPGAIMPQINAGRLMPIATTGPEQLELLNNLPTLREQGVDYADLSKLGSWPHATCPKRFFRSWREHLHRPYASPSF